jgi:hypothetical protein
MFNRICNTINKIQNDKFASFIFLVVSIWIGAFIICYADSYSVLSVGVFIIVSCIVKSWEMD